METTPDRLAQEALQRHFAARQVRIPHDPAKLMHKAETLSADEAKRICEAHAGSRVYGRKPTRMLAEARNDRIRARRKHGATIQQLSDEFDLTPRQIQNILRSYPQ